MSKAPDTWEAITLEDLCGTAAPIIYGILQPGPDTPNGVPYVRPTEIEGDTITLEQLRRTTPEIADQYSRSTLAAGDVLLSIVGTIGKVALVPPELDGGNITQSSCRVRPNSAVCSSKYLANFLRSPIAKEQFDQFRLGTAVPRLNLADVRTIKIPIAPSAEQTRIEHSLHNLLTQSSRARHELDLVPKLIERYKQAILAKAFSGDLTADWRLTNPKVRWSPGDAKVIDERREAYLSGRRGSRLRELVSSPETADLPPTWLNGHLADVVELLAGFAFKSGWYQTAGVRLLRGANIAPGKLDWSDEVRLSAERAAEFSDYRLVSGDIVVAMDRPMISGGFKIARVPTEDDGALLVQRVSRIRPIAQLNPDYAWHYLNSRIFIDHAMSTATGSDLPHISANDILSAPVHLPPLPEQVQIVRQLNAALTWLDRIVTEHARADRLLPKLDQAILAKAFRGKLVPQDPNDEPASVLLERIRAKREGACSLKPAGVPDVTP